MTAKNDDTKLDGLRKEFARQSIVYSQLAHEVQETLKERLKLANLKTAYVLSRVKDTDSFLEKIHRKGYTSPFGQMDDIIGVRIVCLYTEDIGEIAELIRGCFNILKEDPKDKNLGTDKMGYYDMSFIAQLKKSEKELDHYRFEIQVRTIMSDAISIISHDLHYKKEPPLPEKLERELNLAFATMELTQYHCNALRERRKEYVKIIENEAKDVAKQVSFLSQPIADDALRVYTKKLFPDLPIKEHIHALILRDLNPKKYRTLEDIDKAMKYSQEFVKYYKTQSDSFKSGSDYITKSLGYYDEEFMNRHPFAQKTRDAIKKFKKQNS
jgi:ppGpp synthetase/RelA/SpoT-type nucleotidyltranferase